MFAGLRVYVCACACVCVCNCVTEACCEHTLARAHMVLCNSNRTATPLGKRETDSPRPLSLFAKRMAGRRGVARHCESCRYAALTFAQPASAWPFLPCRQCGHGPSCSCGAHATIGRCGDFRPPSSANANKSTGFYYTQMLSYVKQILAPANMTKLFPDLAGTPKIVGFGWDQGWNDGYRLC